MFRLLIPRLLEKDDGSTDDHQVVVDVAEATDDAGHTIVAAAIEWYHAASVVRSTDVL